MRISNRRLISNGTVRSSVPGLSRSDAPVAVAEKNYANSPVSVSLGHKLAARAQEMKQRNKRDPNTLPAIKGSATMEVADGSGMPGGMDGGGVDANINSVQSRNFLTPLLEEFIPTPDMNPYVPPSYLYNMYRDIFYNDSISGAAVEMMDKMAFSDFNLVGLQDKMLDPFYKSVNNLRVRKLLQSVSNEYMVNGLFVAQGLWDDKEKVYTGIIPHNPSFIYVKANPVFGRDPVVHVDFAGSQRLNGATSSRNRKNIALEQVDGVPGEMYSNERYIVPAADLIYAARGGMHKDIRGLSALRRVLPVWLMEKMLIRGTTDQASKRQRGLAHITVGDGIEGWTPSPADFSMIADMWANAALDPVGAVFITRSGISVNEIMRGDDFWKWTDSYDSFSQIKMRALGINEAVLTGEASISTMDSALSLYNEQVRSHRDSITYELFYERVFPRIAAGNNVTISRARKKTLENATTEEQRAKMLIEHANQRRSVFEGGASGSVEQFDSNKHTYPTVQWYKRLRPEADQAYLEILTTLIEKQVPVPLAMLAAAGGLDLDQLLDGLEDDKTKRDKVKEYFKDIGGGEEGAEEASYLLPSRNPLARDFDFDAFDVRSYDSQGHRRVLTARGRREMRDKLVQDIASACAQIAVRENAKGGK